MVRDAPQAALLTMRVLDFAAQQILILRSPPTAGVSKDGDKQPTVKSAASSGAMVAVSVQLQRAVRHHVKVQPADHLRTQRFGGADRRSRLLQRREVRSERDDAAQHGGDRSERGGLAG